MSVIDWDYSGDETVRVMRNGSEITRPATIFVSSADDSLDILKRDLPQLQKWQPHPDQDGFFVEEFNFEKIPNTNPVTWTGYVRWTDGTPKNPLDEPAKLVGIRSEKLQSATNRDRRGNAILNTAGELVAAIPKNEQVRIFTFSKNVSAMVEELFNLEDVVNSDDVQIMGKSRPPRTLLLGKVEYSSLQEQEDTQFYVCTVEVAYRPSKWVHKFASQGYSQIVERRARQDELLNLTVPLITINGLSYVRERQVITLEDGQKPTEPQMLDADGKWIKDPKPEDIHIIEAEVLDEAPFNSILHLFAR